MTDTNDAETPEAEDQVKAKAEPGDITIMLDRWSAGDASALDDLLPQVYDQLRQLAGSYLRRERQDHTLTPTGLVNEAYLRLVGSDLAGATFENRVHFFAAAARSMRRILVDHARRYQAARRASPKDRVILEDDAIWAQIEPRPAEILALDQALMRLRESSPRQADVVELRYFGGLSESEIAVVLDVSRGTVARDWRVARMMLARTLGSDVLPSD